MPFESGEKWSGNGKGRPPGTGHRQRIFNELVLPHKDDLIKKAITLAKDGEPRLLLFFLERLLPPKAADEPIEGLNISGELTRDGAVAMGKQVLKLLADEKITPIQAKAIYSIVQYYQQNIAMVEVLDLVAKHSEDLKKFMERKESLAFDQSPREEKNSDQPIKAEE